MVGLAKLFTSGPVLFAGGLEAASAAAAIGRGDCAAAIFGRHYLSNPDLPKRFLTGAALNPYDRDTFYVRAPRTGCAQPGPLARCRRPRGVSRRPSGGGGALPDWLRPPRCRLRRRRSTRSRATATTPSSAESTRRASRRRTRMRITRRESRRLLTQSEPPPAVGRRGLFVTFHSISWA